MVADSLVKLRVLPLELDVDVKVHVPPVAEVGLHAEVVGLRALAC